MIVPLVSRFFFSMALVVAVGCGSDDGNGDDGGTGARGGGGSGGSWAPSGTPLPLAELGDAFKTVVCRYYMECGVSDYSSLDQCKADSEAKGLKDVEDGVAEGRLTYDPVDVGACRDYFEANVCDLPFVGVPSISTALDLCLSSVGHQQAGEPCRHDLECASGTHCLMRDGVCPGVCTSYLEEGATCEDDSEHQCAPGGDMGLIDLLAMTQEQIEALLREAEGRDLVCIDDRCTARVGLGQPCTEDSSCYHELWCDGETETCQQQRAEGEPCTDSGQCAGELWCDLGSDQAQGLCRSIGGSGDPCSTQRHCEGELRCIPATSSQGDQCSPPSEAGGRCRSYGDCTDGLGCEENSCIELPGFGQACLNGHSCAQQLVCQEDICVHLRVPGEDCNSVDAVCAGRCLNGVCSPRAALGQACEENDDCASRDCTDGRCIDDDLCEFR